MICLAYISLLVIIKVLSCQYKCIRKSGEKPVKWDSFENVMFSVMFYYNLNLD